MSAPRRGVPAAALQFRLAGAVPARALPLRTGPNGSAAIEFVRTSSAGVTVSVAAVNLVQSSAFLITWPPTGFQQLLAASTVPRIASAARTSYVSGPGRPSLTSECTSTCTGNPPLRVAATNPSLAAPIRYYLFRNGVLDATHPLQLLGGKSGSITVPSHDGERVGFGYNYLVGGTWSPIVKLAGSWLIDCPPLPVLTFTGTCNCDDKTVTFSIPTNPTSRPQALTINNQTYVVLPGQALTKTVPMTGTVTVSVGVQKASGAWLTQQQVQINA